jgi:hypothetical protein
MSFGLCNAPATFERLIETALRGLTYDSCLVYLDDVILIGRTFQEHILNLRKVFERFREARLKLNAHCQKVETRAGVKQIRAIAALPAVGWDPVALRSEQPNDPDIEPILREVETGRRPDWKDIADRSPTYKSYWPQWKSLAVRNGILERN